jgi:thioredoxin 1
MKEVLMFGATWCGACKQAEPIVEAACKAKGIPFRKVDTDEQGELATKYNVASLPTTIIIRDDGRWTNHPGKLSRGTITELLEEEE